MTPTVNQTTMVFPSDKPNIHMCDVWPPNTLTDAKMLAYSHFEKSGLIAVDLVQVSKSIGTTTVHYRSTVPKEIVHKCFKDFITQNNDFALKGADIV